MLSDFVTENRNEIIERCRARVATRTAPKPTEVELSRGIPLFLDQLAETLRSKLVSGASVEAATKHGADLLHDGFTIAQVVHDYGDACQAITELAIERRTAISTEDFRALNFCLDEAIADAVTEYGRRSKIDAAAASTVRATEDHACVDHELRNLLGTATLAFDALLQGKVGISGSTGQVLGRSLMSLRNLVDRSLAMVRLNAGIEMRERIRIGEVVDEVVSGALLEARARGLQLFVETNDANAVVNVDRQILGTVVTNLLQNAFKYTLPKSRVLLRTSATVGRVTIEVEDECGGLPSGTVETLFMPFEQRGADRSGLGLGLTICVRGIETLDGKISVRDLPGKGCVFAVALPRG